MRSSADIQRLPHSPEAATVLIVDDEPKIRGVVADALSSAVEAVLEAASGEDALATAAISGPDLIVLDLGLPDLEGIEVCRRLRARTTAPIVVISARHSEQEKTALLDAGADDYITKPFSSAELRARVRAQLRRARMGQAASDAGPLVIGDLSIDVARRTVTREGMAIHLTPTEWGLLSTLVANAARTLTHQQLFRAVWGAAHGDAQQYLRVYVAHLRRKIEADPYSPRYIVTEPGVGYRFEPHR